MDAWPHFGVAAIKIYIVSDPLQRRTGRPFGLSFFVTTR